MRILPAIDIIDGKCVRLTQGDYSQKKIYNENPLEVAKSFQDAGLTHLHLVDLDGAKAGKIINWKTIEDIKIHTSLMVDFGGGVKTTDELEKILQIVDQVNLGSVAVKNRELVFQWIARFGEDKIILSADVQDEKIAIHGWQSDSGINIIDFVGEYRQNNLRYVACTDIKTDGMLKGPNIDLYKRLVKTFPDLKIIASGGVSALADLTELKATGVDGVIVGKAIYEGKVALKDLVSL